MRDVIVVGARCAGSPLALLLARKGYDVLVVDKATFPSDTCSTAFMRPEAVARLEEWGLRDRLAAAGTPEIPGGAVTLNGFKVETPYPFPVFAPRRTVLDHLLVEAAREAGAEVREGVAVRELLREGDTVRGIAGRTRDGVHLREEARLVVGADGANSFVASQVGAQAYDEHPATAAGGYSFWSGIGMDGVELHLVDRGAGFLFPTNDGLACLALELPIEEWPALRADMDREFTRRLAELAPGLGERMAAGRREERYWSMSGRPAFFRKPFGPGWALIGDAGYTKDPILGSGIDDAFRDAEVVAGAADAWLSGRQSFDDAMSEFQEARDSTVAELYRLTCDLASFPGLSGELLGRLAQIMAPPEPAAS